MYDFFSLIFVQFILLKNISILFLYVLAKQLQAYILYLIIKTKLLSSHLLGLFKSGFNDLKDRLNSLQQTILVYNIKYF